MWTLIDISRGTEDLAFTQQGQARMNKEQRTRRIFRKLKIIYLLIFIAIDQNTKLRIFFQEK